MPEKVSILKNLNIIKVDSYGEVKLEDLKQSMDLVIKLHQEKGFTRVFVDASRETSLPTTFPVFDFGIELVQLLGKLKFAVVTSPETKGILRFLETVTVNRGAQVRMFDSENAALGWLIE